MITAKTQLIKHFFSFIVGSSILCGCSQENPTSTPSQSFNSAKMARIATTSDPLSLDPRLIRDMGSINLINALFEGLMRTGPDQKPELGIAKSVDISADLLTYTFTLRESFWSDGTPLTASDFVETWKSTLNPAFPAPNAYLLYAIKGAKAAKEGNSPIESVEVKATSPTNLVVQLEHPTPHFLELLTRHFFFPVSSAMREQPNNYLSSNPELLVSNGPFKMAHWKQRNEVAVIKNPRYWDVEAVKLEGIAFQMIDDNTALQLFNGGELDWAGSPMGTLPQDAIIPLKEQGKLKIAPAAGTHLFRFNTQKAPFDNVKMRKAFNLALDRKTIVEHITQGNQLPALSFVPPSFTAKPQQFYKDHDTVSAQKNYMAALIDLKDSGKKLPEISLCHLANDRSRKIAQAIQQQWNKAFGISVSLESCETQVLFDKLHSGEYQMSLGSWYADIRDPINFLEIFKTKDTTTNNTFWENAQFSKLLEMSALENSAEERSKLLSQAEAILLEELPIAPLYHGSFNYLQNERLEGVQLSEAGIMDFKNAAIKD